MTQTIKTMTTQDIMDAIDKYINSKRPTLTIAQAEVNRYLRDLQTVHRYVTAFSVRTQSRDQLLVEFVHTSNPRIIAKRAFKVIPNYNNTPQTTTRPKDPYFASPKSYDMPPPEKKDTPKEAWDRAMKGIL